MSRTGVNLHYIPVHTQPYFQRMGFKAGNYPHAEHYYAEAISTDVPDNDRGTAGSCCKRVENEFR